MKECFLYILYSETYDKYYVGQSEDVALRLQFHNELSENSYTSRYRPWKVMVTIRFTSRATAMQAERYVKGRKSRAYLSDLIGSETSRMYLVTRIEGDRK